MTTSNIKIGGHAAKRSWLCEMVDGSLGVEHCTVRFTSGDVSVTIRDVPGPFWLNEHYSTFDVASLIDGVWRREEAAR